MGYVIAGLVGVVLLGAAFVIGLMTGDRRWAFLPALLPLVLLGWTGWIAVTEDRSECYDACGSAIGLAMTAVSVVPALILAGATLLGVAVRRGREQPRTATPA